LIIKRREIADFDISPASMGKSKSQNPAIAKSAMYRYRPVICIVTGQNCFQKNITYSLLSLSANGIFLVRRET